MTNPEALAPGLTTESARLVECAPRDTIGLNIYEGEGVGEWCREASALITKQADEIARLQEDVTRQMAIANSECNRAEKLRVALEWIAGHWFKDGTELHDVARAALGEG